MFDPLSCPGEDWLAAHAPHEELGISPVARLTPRVDASETLRIEGLIRGHVDTSAWCVVGIVLFARGKGSDMPAHQRVEE